ncbi:MAG TPA: VCBS repeat-containing protein [Thermoanaerobaculia bacterium]|nr:VCBS repeat-containing protein [Thermoanaerobaculia bacterium]
MRLAKTVGPAFLALTIGVAGETSAQSLPPGYAVRPGFPKVLPGSTGHPSNEPVWANLGLPGGRSLILGTSSKELYVLNQDGSVAAGWPQPLGGQAVSSAAVGDLDGDGIPDIVVGFGGGVWPPADPATVGGVAAFKRDGTLLWVVLSANDVPTHSSFPLGVVSTPAIGDIDADGHADVVWGSWDGHIYAVDGRNGSAKAGTWPLFVRDTIWSSPSLYDLDGNGKLEIIIGTDSHADATANPPGVPPTINGGRLHVLTYLGQEFPGFPFDVDQIIMGSPVVGDITGDGSPKIVFGTGTYWGNPAPCGSGIGTLRKRAIYALRCNGQLLPGFGVANMTSGEVTTSPALADLDGDGVLDVVVTDMDCSTGAAQNFNVYAFKGTGALMWKTKPLAYAGVNLSAGQPVVADVYGDSKLEVLVPTNSEICILSNTGVQLTDAGAPHSAGEFSLYMPSSSSGATLDVVGGVLNVAAASSTSGNVSIHAWTTGKSAPPVWGSYRRDSGRLAVAPNAGTCAPRAPAPTVFHPLPPCRVLDTRGTFGPLGGPALAPMTPRSFNVTGVCGIPALAVAISANLTVTNVTGSGELIVFPSDVAQPGTSSVSFRAGRTRANNALVYLSATTTTFSVFNNCIAGVDFILDVNGYFQ